MKVNAINNYTRVIQNNSSCNLNKANIPEEPADSFEKECVKTNFKGWKWGGTLGSTIGTFAGIGLGAVATLASGGLMAPLLLGCAGCAVGGIAGDVLQAKNDPNYPHDNDFDYPTD